MESAFTLRHPSAIVVGCALGVAWLAAVVVPNWNRQAEARASAETVDVLTLSLDIELATLVGCSTALTGLDAKVTDAGTLVSQDAKAFRLALDQCQQVAQGERAVGQAVTRTEVPAKLRAALERRIYAERGGAPKAN